MVIDASTLFDLLRLVVNRSDEKAKRLADSIFEIYSDNISSINSADIKYCELYIELCKNIISHQLNISDHKIDIVNIFKRHLTSQIFKKDIYIRDALKSIVEDEITPTRLSDITKRMNNMVGWYASRKYIMKLYGHLKESSLSYSADEQGKSLDNVRTLVDDFKNTMLDIDAVSCKGGPVEVINMSDKSSIREAYSLYKERRVNHVLKTGLQGLNQMFGPAGGIALGESVLFAARTHNFKSAMLLKMTQWIVAHSKPPKTPGKDPMILVISLENEGYLNMISMFKQIYISIKNELPPLNMSDEEMVNSIYEHFNKSEYLLVIERYLPSQFGYDEFVRLVDRYENSGFRVIAAIIDYVALMKTHNQGSASRSGDHALLQELFNNIVNYCKAVGTTLLTAHQLNKGASDIVASGVPHPVKLFSERHFAGSMGIAREVDFIAYMEIEHDDQGLPWLTMAWGKHRYVDDTPMAHKFVAYRLHENSVGLVDDIGGEMTGSRNIYKKKEVKQHSVESIESILGIVN